MAAITQQRPPGLFSGRRYGTLSGKSSGATNNVRLSIGLQYQRGGEFANITVVRWRVFSLDGATLHHTGTTGTTNASGVLVIDINAAAFNVGDTVEFDLLFHNGAETPTDRIARKAGGYIVAAAQA